MLFITEEEIKAKYTMKQCIADVEKAFKLASTSKIDAPFRTVLEHEQAGSHTLYMPSYVEAIDYASVKVSSLFPSNSEKDVPVIQSLMILTETNTGKHVATISASELTILRTGAISGVATKYLARKDAKSLAVIGCGAQSLGQVQAVLEVRDIEEVYLYNRTKERAVDLQKHISKQYPYLAGKVTVMSDVKSAVERADVVILSTSSNEPVLKGEYLKQGTHVNAIGSCEPTKQEYDVETLLRANTVYVDTFEGARHEAGALIIPAQKKQWSMDQIDGDLSDLIIEGKGRENDSDITLLDSVGVGFLDTVCAASIYENIVKDK